MSIIETVREIVFRIGGGREPSYRLFYALNVENCVAYWRDFYKIPYAYSPLISSGCRANRMAYIFLDCHGDPMEPSTEMTFGQFMPIYFPDLAWAQGKWKIREKIRSNEPLGTPVPLWHEYDIAAGCCPPDWMNEILGEDGTPD